MPCTVTTRAANRTGNLVFLAYADALEKNQVTNADLLLTEYLAVQRWGALAFVDPVRAAEVFAHAVEGVAQARAPAARLRLGKLLSAVPIPLAGQPQLLAYARGLDALLSGGDEDRGRRLLESLAGEGIRIRRRHPSKAVLSRHDDRGTEATTEEVRKPVCRVVMGYGIKTDFQQNKTFDLDKSYQLLIKPAVVAAGYICERADETEHRGLIDVPDAYRLLTADLVIADLSAANMQAVFELGIRCGLRPSGTMVHRREGFQKSLRTPRYEHLPYDHLGPDIDFDEVLRFRQQLEEILAAKKTPEIDSPVYIHLSELMPPLRQPNERRTDAIAVRRESAPTGPSPTCYVTMGFGMKTDFSQYKSFDPTRHTDTSSSRRLRARGTCASGPTRSGTRD